MGTPSTFVFTDLQEGLKVLTNIRGFDDYFILPGMVRKIRSLATIDEGIHFYSIMGYLSLEDSIRHPLYDGQNRVYTAYLTGIDRLEELDLFLVKEGGKISFRNKLTLTFLLAFQFDSTFQSIEAKKGATVFPWELYMAKCKNWVLSRDEILRHVYTDHWAMENRFYRDILRDMIRIARTVYVPKSYERLVDVFNTHAKIIRSRG